MNSTHCMLKNKIESILPLVQKPARYTGGELNSVVKDKNNIDLRFAFCFPDTYEIGMSHLGMKILYSLINSKDNYWCERVFAPDTDMEAIMREKNIPLFGLESRDALTDFDVIGFTLQYELCYTNVLNMLDLAGVPLRACDRGDTLDVPVVIAGGPCICNPEPVADFFDAVQIGEGEEMMIDFLDLLNECKKQGKSRKEFLKAASQIKGIYVPSLYDISYNDDGIVSKITPKETAPKKVKKRIIVNNLNTSRNSITHRRLQNRLHTNRWKNNGFWKNSRTWKSRNISINVRQYKCRKKRIHNV